MTRHATVILALGAGILLLTGAGLMVQPAGSFGSLDRAETIHYIACAIAAGGLYALAVWCVQSGRLPPWTVAAILVIGLLARLLVLAAPPLLSTDLYRYVWDGRVQAAGINPYQYIPSDPALASLRDGETGPAAIYPNINRVDTAPTIYPPAAQALFAAIGLVAPGIWTVKAAMLAFDLVATATALLLLRAAGRPAAQVLVWAWNPLVIWEFANEGHIDAAALAFSGLALLAAIRLRPALAGAALGIAVLMKLLPAALFPALWRPRSPGCAGWDWRTPVAAAVVILGFYACYAGAGWKVFGYLPGYAAEEELGGSGFLLMRLVNRFAGPLPAWSGAVYAAGALVLLAGLAAWIAFRAPFPAAPAARAHVIARDGLVLSAGLIAVLSPHYPWYLTMLVLPAVLVPAWSALWVTIAGPFLYLDHGHDDVLWPALVFLPALPLLAIDLFSRSRAPSPALLAEGGS